MEQIVVHQEFMNLGIILGAAYIILAIIQMFLANSTGEGWLSLFKVLAYGSLAFVIYVYVDKQGMEDISILDAFTFILCCLEFAGNLVKLARSIITWTAKS